MPTDACVNCPFDSTGSHGNGGCVHLHTRALGGVGATSFVVASPITWGSVGFLCYHCGDDGVSDWYTTTQRLFGPRLEQGCKRPVGSSTAERPLKFLRGLEPRGALPLRLAPVRYRPDPHSGIGADTSVLAPKAILRSEPPLPQIASRLSRDEECAIRMLWCRKSPGHCVYRWACISSEASPDMHDTLISPGRLVRSRPGIGRNSSCPWHLLLSS